MKMPELQLKTYSNLCQKQLSHTLLFLSHTHFRAFFHLYAESPPNTQSLSHNPNPHSNPPKISLLLCLSQRISHHKSSFNWAIRIYASHNSVPRWFYFERKDKRGRMVLWFRWKIWVEFPPLVQTSYMTLSGLRPEFPKGLGCCDAFCHFLSPSDFVDQSLSFSVPQFPIWKIRIIGTSLPHNRICDIKEYKVPR